MYGSDRRLIFCNEQYRAFFPRTGDVRVPGTHFRDILQAAIERGEQIGRPQQDGEKWIEEIVATLSVEGDEEVHLFDGRWLEVRTRPTKDGSSMVVVSEVTRTKEAEGALRVMADQLQLLAATDSLTGLANRRTFDQTLDRELARSQRTGTPLSVALIDIDHFKAFNDLYGHPAGDRCLKVVADCLRQTLKRPTDLAARYGGEEFVAILPDTTEDGAFAIGDDLRLTLKSRYLEHAASARGIVTASVGIAASMPGDAITPLELLSRADEALYAAKRAGRDRITGWNPRRQEGRYAS
jgi:diguanylate cyclase (GGDEF)-like protein